MNEKKELDRLIEETLDSVKIKNLPEKMQEYYKSVAKKEDETYQAWSERISKLETEIINLKEIRRANGEIKTKTWEVPHPPGIKAYGFSVDWNEIDRQMQEIELIFYILQKREEYLMNEMQ